MKAKPTVNGGAQLVATEKARSKSFDESYGLWQRCLARSQNIGLRESLAKIAPHECNSSVERIAEMQERVHCTALSSFALMSADGQMTMTVIAAIAEFESDLLFERTQAILKRAKARGKKLSPPISLTQKHQREILFRRKMGASLGGLAKEFGISRLTTQRI